MFSDVNRFTDDYRAFSWFACIPIDFGYQIVYIGQAVVAKNDVIKKRDEKKKEAR